MSATGVSSRRSPSDTPRPLASGVIESPREMLISALPTLASTTNEGVASTREPAERATPGMVAEIVWGSEGWGE